MITENEKKIIINFVENQYYELPEDYETYPNYYNKQIKSEQIDSAINELKENTAIILDMDEDRTQEVIDFIIYNY